MLPSYLTLFMYCICFYFYRVTVGEAEEDEMYMALQINGRRGGGHRLCAKYCR